MKIRSIILFAALFSCSLPSSFGQINLKKIVKDTERSINRRVERGIERGVDDALDGAEDEVRGRNKKRKKSDTYDESSSTTVIREVIPFSFEGNVMVSIDGTGSLESNLIKLSTEKYEFAVRPMLVKRPNNLMIYNKEEESVTKVNTDLYEDKVLKEFHDYEPVVASKTKTELERTSDIKEIQGYIARKFIVDGDDYEGTVWLSAEVDMDYDLFASLMEFQPLDLGNINGFPLEMHISFKNGDTMDYMVKEIDEGEADSSLFDVSDYDMIDMTDLKSGN